MRIELTTRVVFVDISEKDLIAKINEAKASNTDFILLKVQRNTLYDSASAEGYDDIYVNYNSIVYFIDLLKPFIAEE